MSLFCKTTGCKRAICQLCLIKNHVGHNVVDIVEEHTRKLEILFSKVETVAKDLESKRARILATSDEMMKTSRTCLTTLKVAKDVVLKKVGEEFDKMMEDTSLQMTQISEKVRSDLAAIGANLDLMQSIKENTSKSIISVEDIADKLDTIDSLVMQQNSGNHSCKYTTYSPSIVNMDNVRRLCGN